PGTGSTRTGMFMTAAPQECGVFLPRSAAAKKISLVSALRASTTTWQWPPEVLDFARRRQIDPYLDPLLSATWRVFPTARRLSVSLHGDPELRDDWHVRFEVEVPQGDVANYVQA